MVLNQTLSTVSNQTETRLFRELFLFGIVYTHDVNYHKLKAYALRSNPFSDDLPNGMYIPWAWYVNNITPLAFHVIWLWDNGINCSQLLSTNKQFTWITIDYFLYFLGVNLESYNIFFLYNTVHWQPLRIDIHDTPLANALLVMCDNHSGR